MNYAAKQSKEQHENFVTGGIVLSDIANIFRKTLKTSHIVPVFTLIDLKQIFSQAH